jgi:flagellar biosynthesis protein
MLSSIFFSPRLIRRSGDRMVIAMTDASGDDPSKDRAKIARKSAVAIRHDGPSSKALPEIIASGQGTWAEKIVQIALEAGLKVREDPELAQMLAVAAENSPVPPEALVAVAEILAYVYRAEGRALDDNDR